MCSCSRKMQLLWIVFKNLWDHILLPASQHRWTYFAFILAEQAGTWLAYYRGTEGWIDFSGWLCTEIVYLSTNLSSIHDTDFMVVSKHMTDYKSDTMLLSHQAAYSIVRSGFPYLLESSVKSWIFSWKFQDLETPGKSLWSWKVLEIIN